MTVLEKSHAIVILADEANIKGKTTTQLLTFHSITLSLSTAPDTPKGVVATAKTASVRVSWGAVADADRYTITLSLAQRRDQQGLCSRTSHTATLTVSAPYTTASVAVGGDVGPNVTDILRAYATYEVTVRAVSDVRGTSRASESRRVLTPQTSEAN